MVDAEEVLDRALRYPYATPARSFVQIGERSLEPDSVELGPASREPLLAYGSNAAPVVLAQKLGGEADPILARRATLTGYDVVYSAHVSLYGAVPATLAPSAATEVDVFVLYLTAAQGRALAATEPNYERVDLDPGACRIDGGRPLTRLPAYLSRHGCLDLDGSPVALKAVGATGRRLPAMDEREILEHARAILAPDQSLERFVLDSAADPALARRRSERLRPS